MLAVSHELGATTELLPLLLKIEQAVLQVLDCERSTVFLHDSQNDELYSLVATGDETIRFSAHAGIAGEAFQNGAMINVPDAYADARFNQAIDKLTGFSTRNLLTFPMWSHDHTIVGVLQALNKQSSAFNIDDETRAATLAMLAGIAVQRQMLLKAFEEKKQLEHSLSLARDIQQQLLPTSDPQVPGYEIAGWNKAADETGGDCYYYLPFEDGRLGLLLADASGHGIGPALVVSQCRAMVRALSSITVNPAEVLVKVNQLLAKDLGGGRFITTFFGFLDPKNHHVEYLSAGHGPLLHYQYSTGRCREIDATTYPIGILPDIEETPAEPMVLEPGDIVVLVTDGFFEWANPEGELFGVQRLNDLVHQHRNDSAAQIIALFHDAVRAFGRGMPQEDDLTAIIIKRLNPNS